MTTRNKIVIKEMILPYCNLSQFWFLYLIKNPEGINLKFNILFQQLFNN